MHRFLKIANLAIIFFALLPAGGAKASAYYFGGGITWKVIRQDSVEVKVTLYTDCIYYYYNNLTAKLKISTCDTTYSLAGSNVIVDDITPKCPTACTRCNNYFCSSMVGVYAHTFKVKLSIKGTKCNKFNFSYYDALQRSITINSGPQGTAFYIEANMYKGSNGFVSSPEFNSDPLLYVNTSDCVTQFQSAKPGDSDDSLYYSFTSPMKDSTTKVSYTTAGVSYRAPLKYYGSPNLYASFSNGCGGFRIDSLNGLITFMSTANLVSPMAIKVEQFETDHKGKVVKTGEIIRESTVNSGAWSNSTAGHTPSMISDINLSLSESLDICSKTTFKITITNGGNQEEVKVVPMQPIPGAIFGITTGLKGRTIIAEMTPYGKTIGKTFDFLVIVKDSLCPINKYTSKLFHVRIVDSIPDMVIEKISKGCGTYNVRIKSGNDGKSTFQWQIDTAKVSTDTAFTWYFPSNGSHDVKLIVGRKSGCSKSFNDTINVASFAKVTAGPAIQICQGSTGQLEAKGAKKYSWSPSTGLSSTTSAKPFANPDSSTTYHLTAYDSVGCVYHDSVRVIVFPSGFTLSGDTAICAGSKIKLTARGEAGMTFEWSPSATLSSNTGSQVTAAPLETTMYTVIATNAQGCKTQKNVTVQVVTPNADAGDDISICKGDSVQLHSTGGVKYQWRKNTGITDVNVPDPYVNPLKDQYYKVTTYDSLGCTATDSVLVTVGGLDKVTVRGSALICPGDTVTLEATGGAFYEWSPAEFITDAHVGRPRVYPSENTWYKVTIYDSRHLCSRVDSLRVFIDPDCVWPGDANKDNVVDQLDMLNIGVALGAKGPRRGSIDWKSYHPANWNYVTGEMVNYKHIDVDGDGEITMNDTAIINKYYGRKHGTPITLIKTRPTDPLVYVHFPRDTVYAGDTIEATVYVGSPNKKVQDLYGLGATMNYKNEWMVPGTFTFDAACSFPCGNATTMKMQRINGTSIQFAFIRTDKRDSSGFGPLANIRFVLKDTLSGTYSSKGEILPFYMSHALGTMTDGTLLPLYAASDSVVVMRKHRKAFAGIENTGTLKDLKLYPNPAQNYCIIESSNSLEGHLEVMNALGQNVQSAIITATRQYRLNTAAMKPGIYFVTLKNKSGTWQSKLVIEK
jgi:hypothetical protein